MSRAGLAAVALITLAMLRIASTWTVFSATIDEPMHISAGLQLYTQHQYTYQPENPPLPRLVLALAPYAAGMDFDPSREMNQQLLGVFYSDGRYSRNLVLSRAGNLLFFALAAIATWRWARRELGDAGGLAAALLFTLQPLVIGHSGVATHDTAATAGMAVSLLAFARWLDTPVLSRAMVMGAAFGFAVLCKFSSLGYVPAACLAIYAVRFFRGGRAPLHKLAAGALSTVLVISAGYAFRLDVFLQGLRGLARIDGAGTHFGYLFGELSTQGWWYYFPVAVGLKSTLASLLLAAVALVVARKQRVALEALAAVGAILLVAMPSHLDLGVRYVLPLFVPLSVAAAAAVMSFKRRWIGIALLIWHTAASLVAHPDTIPYFNEAAGREPWRSLADSNIDWGQDVLRLRRVLEEKKVSRIGLAIYGWHRWDDLGFPPHHEAYPTLPTQGWTAVSEHLFQIKNFTWLRGRKYERVGKSIRLYYIQ